MVGPAGRRSVGGEVDLRLRPGRFEAKVGAERGQRVEVGDEGRPRHFLRVRRDDDDLRPIIETIRSNGELAQLVEPIQIVDLGQRLFERTVTTEGLTGDNRLRLSGWSLSPSYSLARWSRLDPAGRRRSDVLRLFRRESTTPFRSSTERETCRGGEERRSNLPNEQHIGVELVLSDEHRRVVERGIDDDRGNQSVLNERIGWRRRRGGREMGERPVRIR